MRCERTVYLLAYVIELNFGSVFDTITRDTFANIEVNLPSIKEQQAIADTLTALDDRIAVNNKLNHHLEQIAHTIFKSWFVDMVAEDISGNYRAGK